MSELVRYEAPGFTEVRTESGEFKKYDPDCVSPAFLVERSYHPGDTIELEVKTNEYAISGEYEIIWQIGLKDILGDKNFQYTFTEKDIGRHFAISCKINSLKNRWHRNKNNDHSIVVYVNVLP